MTQLRAASHSDIGRVRQRNEDRLILDEQLGLFGVADGVGGLPGGAEAAELSLHTIAQNLPVDVANPDLVKIVRATNKAVYELGRTLSPGTGIGSTLCVGRVHHAHLQIAHVGDSRCYCLRGEEITPLTEDHSVENEIRQRRARGEDVHFQEYNRNALTRCIGQPTKLEVDVVDYALQSGDRILFCTDGITGLVSDKELGDSLGRHEEPKPALHEIIELALSRGGHDNATGVVLYIDGVS